MNPSMETKKKVFISLETTFFDKELHVVQLGAYCLDTMKSCHRVFTICHKGFECDPRFQLKAGGIFFTKEDGTQIPATGKHVCKGLDYFFSETGIESSTDKVLTFYTKAEMEIFHELFSKRGPIPSNLTFTNYEDFIQMKGGDFKPLDIRLGVKEPVYSADLLALRLKDLYMAEGDERDDLYTPTTFPVSTSKIRDINVDKGFILNLSSCLIRTDRAAWVPAKKAFNVIF